MQWQSEFSLLRTSGWLSETSESFRDSVLSRCVVKSIARGETLYRAGDEPGGLFGLLHGGFGVIVAPGERAPYLGIIARPGFWIGEASVITRGPRAIGIMAARDSTAAHLTLRQWDAIVRSDPEAWRWLAHLSLRNELMAIDVVDALRMRRSEDRLAAILAVLSTDTTAGVQGRASSGHPVSTIEISQDDLAMMSNLSRSSVGRILDDFEARGLITRNYRMVSITDPKRLQLGYRDGGADA